jgi:peptide/nickel transport system permease protein
VPFEEQGDDDASGRRLEAGPVSVVEPSGTSTDTARSARRERLGELRNSKTFLVGSAVILFWIVCALFGNLFVPHDPYAENLLLTNLPPSTAHWFGTDQLGRDVFSRVIIGSRTILIVSLAATVLGTVLGTIIGLVTGYFGGLIDNVSSRLIEALLALPVLIVAFLFVVAVGHSLAALITIVGVVFAFIIARTVRSAVLIERELDYVATARLYGEGPLRIMFVEILPNVTAPIIVEFTVRLGYAIFTIAALSFLGFGIQQPTPDWGGDISANYGVLTAGFWWETLFDALAIASLVIAVNLVADSIEGVFNQ